MDVSVVKNGKRGRPRFRRYTGFISQHGPYYWAFTPDFPDLFGYDSVLLNVGYSFGRNSITSRFTQRIYQSICCSLCDGKSVHVELSFSGEYCIHDQLSFFDFRFVRFVDPVC